MPPPAEDHRSGAGTPAPSGETIVVHKGHGLPYSKGLMTQAISATGLSPGRAFELARVIEERLDGGSIRTADLHALAEDVLRTEQDETTARRYASWRRLDRLERPVVVLLGGTTGVGKSTLATMLAARLGVNRVIATDVIRQVLRAFFTHEAMPTVHHSAFEAGGIPGYRDQAEHVGTGITAIVDRAASEAKPVVVEGVHVVPGAIHPRTRERIVLVEALIVVEDADLHRGHFSHRRGTRPAERYIASFDDIRRLQDHLWERARSEGVTVVDNENVDDALARLMQLVLDAVQEVQ
jgi:2-phosphoglycerate kinase